MDSLTNTFNTAAGGPTGESETINSGPSPTGPESPGGAFAAATEIEERNDSRMVESHQPLRLFTVEEAETELEVLERGRATPKPQNNFDPPDHVKNVVDVETERRREARVVALKAYVQFQQLSQFEAEFDRAERLELG